MTIRFIIEERRNRMGSQAIINTMEVLETKPINDLLSEVIIKVCYVSDEPNPNNTIITREVGKEIGATLPGAPVAGFFNEETGDFEQHNRQVIFSNGEINIKDVTKAYGFVSPTDAPWYQDFDEDGVTRTYLMCKAFLWTRQYEEASLAVDKGQSMELDDKSMSGYFEGDVFVFTSVTLEKLCILGDDYAPCFAGAEIIKNYTKGYTDLAEQLENIIGRRYYVMDGNLETKPDVITLDYAIKLGWNLTDAVYTQLFNRGAAEKYDIDGIFADSGSIFVILQDRESLELVKCTLTITDKDLVELGTEMVAVSMTWVPKGPAEPEKTEPLQGGEIPVAGPATTVETYMRTPLATPPAAPAAASGDPTPEPAPVNTFALEYPKLVTQIAEFTKTVGDLNIKLAEAESVIAEYRKAEAAAEVIKKDELITSYSAILSEEEITPIKEKIADYTLETLEAKLAVVYAKKQIVATPTTQYQVDLTKLQEEFNNLPDFMKQAIEYDKSHNIDITIAS